ncbi:MAG: delta-60 repeat domain-containing protein [Xanthomonadales bacterium]|jgi:uncharacterized delta-60 repeat protein|nr:delta-60 repeat domain-containing protein [Xanthomonadales bacterium]
MTRTEHITRRLASLAILFCLLAAGAQAALAEVPNGVACRVNVPPLQPLELDPTFAGDGTLELQIENTVLEYSFASKGYFDDSGDILLFGTSNPGNASFTQGVLLRLGPDGSPGPLTEFPAQAFGCSAPRQFFTALRLASGDYAAGGYIQGSCSGIPRWFNVLRLAPNGIRLDEFEWVRFNNQLAYVFALAEQADGKIVASGLISQSGSDSSTFDFGVARYNLDGTLDTTFAGDGTFVFDLEGGYDFAQGIAVDASGRILVGGFGTSDATDRDVLVLGLTPAGVLDPGFGNGGVFRWDRGGLLDSLGAFSLTEERILVGGSSQPDANTREMTVIAITRDGQLDPTFAGDGVATIPLASDAAGVSALTVGPRGHIYVAGSAEIDGTGLAARDAVVAVLQPDGTPDDAFNGGAPKVFSFGALPRDIVDDIELDATGSLILVTGSTEREDQVNRYWAAARLIGLQPGIFCDGLEP